MFVRESGIRSSAVSQEHRISKVHLRLRIKFGQLSLSLANALCYDAVSEAILMQLPTVVSSLPCLLILGHEGGAEELPLLESLC